MKEGLVFIGTFSTKSAISCYRKETWKTVVTGWSWWGWTTKKV